MDITRDADALIARTVNGAMSAAVDVAVVSGDEDQHEEGGSWIS
ncbi:MAG: hypothetical protein ABIQ92_01350 [Ornithinibacter sp.]